MDNSKYLLLSEAAERARTSVSTVSYWIRIGKLPASRPGRRVLIAEADLECFLAGGNCGESEPDDSLRPLAVDAASKINDLLIRLKAKVDGCTEALVRANDDCDRYFRMKQDSAGRYALERDKRQRMAAVAIKILDQWESKLPYDACVKALREIHDIGSER